MRIFVVEEGTWYAVRLCDLVRLCWPSGEVVEPGVVGEMLEGLHNC